MTPTPPLRGDLLRTPVSAARVAADLRGRGFRVGRLDAHDRAEFVEHVAAALQFPAHYGRNLDALWDCLTDLTVPTALVWTGWVDLAVSHPDDWAAVMAVLVDRIRAEPPFTLVLAAASAGH